MDDSSVSRRTTLVNGIEMYYEVQGRGEPLLLLHGFTGIGEDWVHAGREELARDHQLLVPDLRGHGRSTNPAKTITHRQCALDVLALLDQLHIGRCQAVGLSLGGNVLLHMATQQPDRLEALVLVSATMYFPEEARAIMGRVPSGGRTDEEWAFMRTRHRLGDDQILALWAQQHAFKDSHEDMSFTPPLLSTIRARTLIVHGDRDPLYPVCMAVDMYRAIPRATLWVVPKGGHGPIFGEQRGPFVRTTLAFLEVKRTEQAGPPPLDPPGGRIYPACRMEIALSLANLVFVGFVSLFPPVNPIGTALLMDPLLRGLSLPARRAASSRIALYCFMICVGSILVGSWLFKLFGISLPIVQLAGGILICRMGWHLLSSDDGVSESQASSAPERAPGDIEGILFYPLAFPMTTGAGTISVLLTLSAHGDVRGLSSYLLNLGALFIAIVLMCVLIFLSYAYTPALLQRLGRRGEQIVNRLSAFLVFCVGLQIAVAGIKHLIGRT